MRVRSVLWETILFSMKPLLLGIAICLCIFPHTYLFGTLWTKGEGILSMSFLHLHTLHPPLCLSKSKEIELLHYSTHFEYHCRPFERRGRGENDHWGWKMGMGDGETRLFGRHSVLPNCFQTLWGFSLQKTMEVALASSSLALHLCTSVSAQVTDAPTIAFADCSSVSDLFLISHRLLRSPSGRSECYCWILLKENDEFHFASLQGDTAFLIVLKFQFPPQPPTAFCAGIATLVCEAWTTVLFNSTRR